MGGAPMCVRKALCKPHLALSETKLAQPPSSAAHPVQNSPSTPPPAGIPRKNSPNTRLLGLTREKVRPAQPLHQCFREKVRPAGHNTPFLGHLSCAGRTFSRSCPHRSEQGELYPACGAASGTKLSPPPGSAAHPVQNSPSKRPWQAHPVQNSPSEPQNADFGPLFACRENFVPLPPPTTRAGRKKSRTNTPPQPSNVPLSKFRMQFDCVNFQQSSETLQFQRHEFTL